MIKPWHLGPVLAVAALAASAYWWHNEKDRWSPPPPRKPDLPKVEPMPEPISVRAKQAVERPLFWTSRRPVVVDEKKTSLVTELTQSRLTAVLESGLQRVAILQRADGTTLKITGETKPWRIESFDGRNAVFLSADDQRVERPLEAGSAAAPKAGPIGDRLRRPTINQ
ncbi:MULTISPECIES: hypothetical protein [unclassified Acidovorax]|jgi:hypothetical protein|uniref:hypothetical protein n=1 Tax=unclassified Acidovorax TaxID=2684926 RepID=UPI002102F630|nr:MULTISPECIES: hypothetical protein [unclassified Acidovorax]